MDLVDIDKVLDNLELCVAADENNRREAEANLSQPQASALDGRANGIVSSIQSSTNKVHAVNNGSKSFVGVSQVFNSLDDYREDVKSLEEVTSRKYDSEFRPIVTSENPQKPESSVRSRLSEDFARKPSVEPLAVHKVAHVAHGDHLNDGHSVTAYEQEADASNDIHKFTENCGRRFLAEDDIDDGTNTTNSDSLTTSSSSTFSSGPSPGLESPTDEHLTPLSPAQDGADADFVVAQDKADTSESISVLPEHALLQEPAPGIEDLAVGLSSISIDTGLPSGLEHVLETTTTSQLSQLRDTNYDQPDVANKDQSHFIKQNISESMGTTTKDPSMDVNISDGNSLAVKKQEKQQPITFNSTMDEISDTELDSMLQEMDVDSAAENKMKNPTSSETVDVLENMPQSETLPRNESIVTQKDNDVPLRCSENLNADSFSQASTVEFSEDVRSQPISQEPMEHLGQDMNSQTPSYSSCESSLDDDIGSDCEDAENCPELRPQRPTTLDLRSVQMSSLLANAGQTPPGNNDNYNTTQSENSAKPLVQPIESTSIANPMELPQVSSYSMSHSNLGKIPPIWVPDNMATACMQCNTKFTMIKRRHHCRACGQCVCSVCCSQKFKLEFLADPESRVCVQCYLILAQRQQVEQLTAAAAAAAVAARTDAAGSSEEVANVEDFEEGATAEPSVPNRSPNPNNPMEYCSKIPPHRQVSSTSPKAPPAVIVPVGVLKKENSSYSSNSSNSSMKTGRKRKSVMFSDGIAPGSELAGLEHQWSEAKHAKRGYPQRDKTRNNGPPTPMKPEADMTPMGLMAQLLRGAIPPSSAFSAASFTSGSSSASGSTKNEETKRNAKTSGKTEANSKSQINRQQPTVGNEQCCLIPKGEHCLPPEKRDDSFSSFDYKEVINNFELVERLQQETIKFVVQKNLFVLVKIVNLKCCMNRTVINFTTQGMHHVGNDEIIFLLEYEPPANREAMLEPPLSKDIFEHINQIYCEAELGSPIAELAYTSPRHSSFLGSREYGGFIFIRPSFQCLQDVIIPENPFLIGILIHRHEIPWAKVFPLRLILRLGAQYRYYPCPHISMRNRESVYAEIAQTIINFLADFRNYSYTLPAIRGMYIHMEDRQTTVLIPRNRHDDVIKAINNASDHILAFGGNFSKTADGHLVCMQNVSDEQNEMFAYSTQAINIQGQPRKVTGASFFVLNEALKSSSGLSGKCSIVEDGLMVQILPAKMEEVRSALRNTKDIDIVCGPLEADEQQTEVVSIKWVENDRDFNIGVKSSIDEQSMEGVASMRVHASFNYSNDNYFIRLTEIYIIKFDEWYNAPHGASAAASLDITRIAEQIARSASVAMVPFLDLLVTSGIIKIGLRVTLHQDNVCYEAGARGSKLPPLYMNALDNHLIPTLHNESSGIDNAIILELIFYILNI